MDLSFVLYILQNELENYKEDLKDGLFKYDSQHKFRVEERIKQLKKAIQIIEKEA